ncbi:hypothetical protein DAPPUDRAFT_325222 [Daphnia pulex]|uniref:Uncharacterized protein n=1 Tax=Daphnia pulex TaxID=6669 RepID=E9H428_DAPPU|nr:hypothetical protein DAPPUDRAFT_325222 [Daphnia pulex]|eukprot:EFX73509.1 hypothetical protein DAPPUDRAFT_325222 [Daphnia pulex]
MLKTISAKARRGRGKSFFVLPAKLVQHRIKMDELWASPLANFRKQYNQSFRKVPSYHQGDISKNKET